MCVYLAIRFRPIKRPSHNRDLFILSLSLSTSFTFFLSPRPLSSYASSGLFRSEFIRSKLSAGVGFMIHSEFHNFTMTSYEPRNLANRYKVINAVRTEVLLASQKRFNMIFVQTQLANRRMGSGIFSDAISQSREGSWYFH